MPTTLTIREPADIIAVLPTLLGFFPHESVTAIVVGGPHGMCAARVDMPDEDHVAEMIDAFVTPLGRASVSVLLAFITASDRAKQVNERLCLALTAAGCRVVESVQYRDGQMRGLLHPAPWFDVDIQATEIAAQGTLDGHAPAASRDEMRQWVSPRDPVTPPKLSGWERWERSMLYANAPTDEHIGRVLAAMADPDFWDTCLLSLERNARDQLDWWTLVARRAPAGYQAQAYALLALCAWVNGHGALAWVAHDLSVKDGECALSAIVRSLLVNAVPPTEWTEMRSRICQ